MPPSPIFLENNLIQLCEIFLKDLTDPLSIIDSEYRIYWANRRKAGEHNLSREEIIGKVCYEIFSEKINPVPNALSVKLKLPIGLAVMKKAVICRKVAGYGASKEPFPSVIKTARLPIPWFTAS